MPRRPLSPCRQPGCSALVDRGYCPAHKDQAWKPHDRVRGTAAKRGYNGRHRKWRKMVLARDPICKVCDEATSTIADHIVPLDPSRPWEGDWSLDNGQGVCQACHNAKTARERVGGSQIPGPKEPGTGPQSHARGRDLKRKNPRGWP